MAALATFSVGIYAARYFTPEDLGIYALFFAAFLVAAIVPFKLAFLPSEVQLLEIPQPDRLGGFRLTMPAGLPVALGSGLITLMAVIPAWGTSGGLLWPLAITAFVTSVLSPIQDHIRRVMHLAGRSWLAALTSTVQLSIVVTTITFGLATGLDDAWVPFGGLAAANTISIMVGLALARRHAHPVPGTAYPLQRLARSGKWLTGIGLMPAGAAFAAAAIVALLAGDRFLGFAEAARVAARPLLVFMTGLSAVLNPPSMEAGRDRNHREGIRLARLADQLVIGVGILVLAWLGINWIGNPMAALVEGAYEIGGLVALTIVANIAWGALFSQEAQLIGGSREVDLFRVHAVGAVVQVIVAFSAPITEAYALPLSIGAFAIVRWIGFQWALARLYRPSKPSRSDGALSPR